MQIKIDNSAIKELSKINKSDAIKILAKIETLKDFPNISNLKKLTNFQPPYRLRVGKYRVLFDIEDNILTVYKVKHRGQVYK